MREIKFSILLQHSETGSIVDRRFSYADLFNGIAKEEINKLSGYAVIARREYTGLPDQKGQEIYEGDFLKVDWHDSRYPVHTIGPVTWDKENAGWDMGEGSCPKLDAHSHFEVIGNRWETPEIVIRSHLSS